MKILKARGNPRERHGSEDPPLQVLVDLTVQDLGDLLDFAEEVGEVGGKDGLDAVGEGFVGLVVDFDEETIGADCYRRAGERENFVTFAGAVRRIDEDGKVAAFFYGRDYG